MIREKKGDGTRGMGEEPILYQIDLQKAVKETVERIVGRGCIANDEEEILISTAALLCEFLRSTGVDVEMSKRAEAWWGEVGFFFPPLTEAILGWAREGKSEVIDGIEALAAKVSDETMG